MARKTTSISFRDITRPIVRLCGMALLGAALVQATVSPAAAAQDKPVLTDRMLDGRMESSYLPAKGSSLKWGRATALVNAPLKDIMAVIENYGDYTEFLPNCKVSRVLSQRGASALIYLKISSLHGAASIWAELKARPKKSEGDSKIIEVKMLKGNIDTFGARWEVTPLNDSQSLVTFQLLVDPDMPVPSSMINSENQKNARKTIRALRALMVRKGLAVPNKP